VAPLRNSSCFAICDLKALLPAVFWSAALYTGAFYTNSANSDQYLPGFIDVITEIQERNAIVSFSFTKPVSLQVAVPYD